MVVFTVCNSPFLASTLWAEAQLKINKQRLDLFWLPVKYNNTRPDPNGAKLRVFSVSLGFRLCLISSILIFNPVPNLAPFRPDPIFRLVFVAFN
jgi:hypothetical protein